MILNILFKKKFGFPRKEWEWKMRNKAKIRMRLKKNKCYVQSFLFHVHLCGYTYFKWQTFYIGGYGLLPGPFNNWRTGRNGKTEE